MSFDVFALGFMVGACFVLACWWWVLNAKQKGR